jgi:hypothetical protein
MSRYSRRTYQILERVGMRFLASSIDCRVDRSPQKKEAVDGWVQFVVAEDSAVWQNVVEEI